MNTIDKDFDDRLRRAFPNTSSPSTDDGILGESSLAARTPSARDPHATRRIASTSLLGVGALAVVGVVVTSFVLPSQGPLFTMAESGQGVASAEMSSSDMRIGLWVQYEYEAGEGLSTDPGRGAVYQLELDGTPEALLEKLGATLGVSGEAQKSQYFDPQWPSYFVGTEDWTSPSIGTTWTGTGNWYYNNPAAYPEPICTDVPLSEDGTEGGYQDCVTPEPTGELPSVEQATAEAVELFRATGLEVSAADVRVVSNDAWGIGVSAALYVNGTETALEWTAYWVPGPLLSSASGHSVVVRERGEFDTISPVDAVDRLAAGAWWGSPATSYYYGATGIAGATTRSPDVSVGSAEDGSTGVAEPEVVPDPGTPTDEPTDEVPTAEPELLPEPLPEPELPTEPEIIRATVTSAESALLLVWDASGNAWLVPGYVMRYGDDDWSWLTVISLIEGIIEIPEPMPIDIMPMPAPLPEPYIEE